MKTENLSLNRSPGLKKKKYHVQQLTVYTISCLVIWRGLNQRYRHDAIRENDGNRMLMHWKFDMLHFVEMHHPKYFLVGQRTWWRLATLMGCQHTCQILLPDKRGWGAMRRPTLPLYWHVWQMEPSSPFWWTRKSTHSTYLLSARGRTMCMNFLRLATWMRHLFFFYILVIFKRKTMPKEKFPPGVFIKVHQKGWMDKKLTNEWLDKVWRSQPKYKTLTLIKYPKPSF